MIKRTIKIKADPFSRRLILVSKVVSGDGL